MSLKSEQAVFEILALVEHRNPHEPEFHQAVREVLATLRPVLEQRPDYAAAGILHRIV